jgi:hypothetical protein
MAASLYEELSAKLEKDPRLTKPRNACEDVRALWEAAQSVPENAELSAAVERLRPIFGRR